MNLINLFGNKNKQPQPEYFLAVEIHESLIKTALWEILAGEPSVVSVGSYESWADEDSLINGVDLSLEQAVKVISSQPKRVIFGFPDSWMDEDKIHQTKIKLVSRLCKELGLEPIGAVTINRAVAHFLKKREGVPPTTILLELYTTKIALSYIYLGEVKSVEEVAKSGDLGHDVEEGLTRMDLPNYPARFILTNGSDMSEESQQITSYPWQDKLPFKHLPKVESLSVDFSIKAIALIGGTEAVKFMGLEVNDEDEPAQETESLVETSTEDDNLSLPSEDNSDIEDLGFAYEEVDAPEEIKPATPDPVFESDVVDHEPQFAFATDIETPEAEESNTIIIPQKKKFSLPKLPSLPKLARLRLPKFKVPPLGLLAIPLVLILGFIAYLFLGSAEIMLYFTPQNYTQSLSITVATAPQANTPTLVALSQKVNGSAHESTPTTGQATVGDKASGFVTIANKTVAPLVLKKGTTITTDNGKYTYTLDAEVTIASASSGLLDTISGKASNVRVTATKIGAEYNLSQDNTFSVDSYSRTVAIAISEKEFTGGTSRSVNAVSKADQDKVLAQATEKIKQTTDSQIALDSPGKRSIPVSDIQFTKKVFDKNIGDEATAVALDLEGSLETFVYNETDLFNLVSQEIKPKLPAGTLIQPASTKIKIENLTKEAGQYKATVSVSASLYPVIDEVRLADFVKGKSVKSIRHFFEPIKGFKDAEVNISPAVPFITQIIPLKNITFKLLGN